MKDWYQITNVDKVDSPALAVYPDRIKYNINLAINTIGDVDRLRPHVKTNKISEVCQMMLDAGISKFKCATIPEAEMLAKLKAPDVLLAYQPVGPKVARFINLIKTYPDTCFSCLVDNENTAEIISSVCVDESLVLDIFIDINVGMNRTGVLPEKAIVLAKNIRLLSGIKLKGIHAYDGHIHDNDLHLRKNQADESYQKALDVIHSLKTDYNFPLTLIIGGTPTFSIHAKRSECECSPGTFVFWDWGYKKMIEEIPFQYAAVVVARVISIIDQYHICIDLGYKAIAAESSPPRLCFLNVPDALQLSQSEEHLVLKVTNSRKYPIGTVFYGIPLHICPTVALYEKVQVVEKNENTTNWRVIARKR
jgi:Predicted amino acid aldolase or racemase